MANRITLARLARAVGLEPPARPFHARNRVVGPGDWPALRAAREIDIERCLFWPPGGMLPRVRRFRLYECVVVSPTPDLVVPPTVRCEVDLAYNFVITEEQFWEAIDQYVAKSLDDWRASDTGGDDVVAAFGRGFFRANRPLRPLAAEGPGGLAALAGRET
jgi:hypothetical protein